MLCGEEGVEKNLEIGPSWDWAGGWLAQACCIVADGVVLCRAACLLLLNRNFSKAAFWRPYRVKIHQKFERNRIHTTNLIGSSLHIRRHIRCSG